MPLSGTISPHEGRNIDHVRASGLRASLTPKVAAKLVCSRRNGVYSRLRSWRGRKAPSGVINLASTATFQPLAGADVYTALKAFVLFLSEALALEPNKSGVTVTAAFPGPVAMQFFATMRPKLQADQMDKPAPVVRDILRGFEQVKRVVYPGKRANRLGI